MANVYDFLGAEKDFFMKSSWDVYTSLNGNRQYVGKTGNEKTLSPSLETIDWWDNASGVQTLFVQDIVKNGVSVAFNFMQVADKNALALFFRGEIDSSGANDHYIWMGSNPPALEEAEWRFVAQSRSQIQITLVIRKGTCIANGDWTSGAPGDYTNLPVKVSALQDTSITNTQRDLAYFILEKKAYS